MGSQSHNSTKPSAYLEKLARHRVMDATEERLLIRRVQRGDKKAEDAILRLNVRLILLLTKKFQGQGFDVDELFQVGSIGFLVGVRKYDLRRKDTPRLATYAAWWVKAYIQRFVLENFRSIRLPALVAHEYRRSNAIGEPLTKWFHDSDTSKRSKAMRTACLTETVSFDQPAYGAAALSGSEDGTMLDTLKSLETDGETALLESEEQERIVACLNRLRRVDREVLRLRAMEELTLEQVADRLVLSGLAKKRLSRERVRQIEMRAKRKLAEILREEGISN